MTQFSNKESETEATDDGGEDLADIKKQLAELQAKLRKLS